MQNTTLKTLITEIEKNDRVFTHLICNVFSIQEALALYKAVSRNTNLVKCSIFTNIDNEEYKEIKLVIGSVISHIKVNRIFHDEYDFNNPNNYTLPRCRRDLTMFFKYPNLATFCTDLSDNEQQAPEDKKCT